MVNDRWGSGSACKHGGFYTCSDRYNPGHLVAHKWENCFTVLSSILLQASLSDTQVDRPSFLGFSSYSERSRLHHHRKSTTGNRHHCQVPFFWSPSLCLLDMSLCSCGGNVLINIGPTSYGKIIPVFEERLRQMGSWLKVNGDAIYKSVPWKYQNDTVNSNVWFVSLSLSRGWNVDLLYLSSGTRHRQMASRSMHHCSPGRSRVLKSRWVHRWVQLTRKWLCSDQVQVQWNGERRVTVVESLSMSRTSRSIHSQVTGSGCSGWRTSEVSMHSPPYTFLSLSSTVINRFVRHWN